MTKEAYILLTVSVTLILTFIAAIIITWLYNYISQANYRKINTYLDAKLSAYFEANLVKDQRQVIHEIKEYVGTNILKKKQLIERILQYGDQFIDSHTNILLPLYEETGIKELVNEGIHDNQTGINKCEMGNIDPEKLANTE